MTSPRIGIIVFARMSSQRLLGKVLMDFGGRPLLAHILARASAMQRPLIVATSTCAEDDAVARLAESCGAPAFRGSLDDVLQRAVDCADTHGFDAFARLCGDRPYFPQDQMRDALAAMAISLTEAKPADLFSNHVPQSPPPGLSTEVVGVSALRRALAGGATAHHREHLTSYLYEHAQAFDIRGLATNVSAPHGHCFAIDTANDLERLGAVAKALSDVHTPYMEIAARLQSPMHVDAPRSDQ